MELADSNYYKGIQAIALKEFFYFFNWNSSEDEAFLLLTYAQ